MKRLWCVLMMNLGVFVCTWADAQTALWDEPWAVWAGYDGNDTEIFYARKKGGQWSSPARLNPDNAEVDTSPSVVVDGRGRPFTVWVREESSGPVVYGAIFDGGKWSNEEKVGGLAGLRFSQPAAAILDDGSVVVIACAHRDGEDDIYWTRQTSSGWTDWKRLSSADDSPDFDPALLAYRGKLWVVWTGFDGAAYQLYYRVWDGNVWTSEDAVFPGESSAGELPALSVQRGRAYLSFYRDGKTFSTEWTETGWSAAVPVSLPDEPALVPVWKNHGAMRASLGWYASPDHRGSFLLILPVLKPAGTQGVLALKLKRFFDLSPKQAWAATTPGVYSAFGDSITRGVGNGGYPPFLQARLTSKFGPSTVINRGVGGETTSSGVNRINNVLNADNPEFILIMEGTNDIGFGRSEDSAAFNLGVMMDRAIGFGARPIISTVTPRLDGSNDPVRRLNDLIRGLAGQKGVPLTDNFSAINAVPDADDNLYTDHIHFNDTGNDIMAEAWFQTISGLKGGGGGGGGCGSVQSVPPGTWGANYIEPLALLLLAWLVLRRRRKVIS